MAIFNPTGDVTGKARIIERTFDGDPNPSTLGAKDPLGSMLDAMGTALFRVRRRYRAIDIPRGHLALAFHLFI